MHRAYYNEIDPHAAEWLRNLISAGHIMAGDVDERSITDVRPADIAGYTRVHLFAGIGGWELGLRLAGWPEDLPVWSGSCPCQPFSAAGKRGGTDDVRHLWPVMFGLIRECNPDRVIGEQVAGAVGLGWLDGVCADLEGIGYSVGACVLGAHSVGAPHIRQRLWWVADAGRAGIRGEGPGQVAGAPGGVQGADWQWKRLRADAWAGCADAGGLVYPERDGRGTDQQGRGQDRGAATRGRSEDGGMGDAAGPRPLPPALGRVRSGEEGAGPRDAQSERRSCACGNAERMCDADGWRCGRWRNEQSDGPPALPSQGDHWGSTCLPCSDGTARRAQPGIHPLAHGVPRGVGELCAGGESLGDDPAALLRDAQRYRKTTLRGAGNAIVPQVAALFIRAYIDTQDD